MKYLTLLFLVFSIVFTGASPVAEPPVALQTPPDRPNIIWIVCEDMSPHLGSYGETVAKTPHLDALASESIRFTNAFSTAGVCAPSRSALITGMYQTAIGTHHMRVKKSLNAPEAYPANFVEYDAVPPAYVRTYPEYLRTAGYYCTNNAKTDYQFEAPPTTWDESSPKATYANRPDRNQPFFAIFNLGTTHESNVHRAADQPLLVSPEEVAVPPYYPDTKVVRNDIARFLTNVMRMDTEVGAILSQLKKDGVYDKSIIFFYSDHGDGLPYVKREVLDRGMRVPLLVRFPDGQKAGTTDERLVSFIDFAPTLLSLASVPVPDYMHGRPFLGSQTTPTPHKYIFGARDRMDSEYDRVRSVHDGRFQYIRNYMANLPRYQHIRSRLRQPMMEEILRLKDAKRLNPVVMRWFESKPLEELYDLQSDPHQLHDLAKDPRHRAKLDELRKALGEWSSAHDLYGEVPEMEMVSQWWQGREQPPTTATPTVQRLNGKLAVSCPTPGASVGYRFRSQDAWTVYEKPFTLAASDSLYVVAQRIGYQPSRVVAVKDIP